MHTMTMVTMEALEAVLDRPFISKYILERERQACASRMIQLLRSIRHDHAPRSSSVNRMANWLFQLTEARLGSPRDYQNVANNMIEGLVQEGLISKVSKPWVNTETGEEHMIKTLICHVPIFSAGVTGVEEEIPLTRSTISGRTEQCLGFGPSVTGIDQTKALDLLEQHTYVLDRSLLPHVAINLASLPETKVPHVKRTMEDAQAVGDRSYHFGAFLDWRGRINTETGGTLSYQSCRYSRAMVRYQDSRYVDDSSLLLFKAWVDREFGLENRHKTERELIVGDPRKGIMALSAYRELDKLETGDRHSNFIVYPDASCSGMQMAALMLRSPALARATNLIGDNKSDLYTMVANEANVDEEHRTRDFSKPIVTVINYGGGPPKCKQHTANNVPPFAALPDAVQEHITEQYHQAFFRLFPECRWLINESRKPVTKAEVAGGWWHFINPMGTRCWSGKLVNTELDLEEIGHSRYGTNCSVKPMELDRGMAGSLANLTHSVDAAIATAVVLEGGPKRPVSPIHDSFGVHIANMAWVTECYLEQCRKAYRWMPTWFRMNGMGVAHGTLNEADITNGWALS